MVAVQEAQRDTDETTTARLLLGPLLRRIDVDGVGGVTATIWVETDRPCTVEVLGNRSATFCIAGHHYGLVVVGGLDPAAATPYTVELDGQRVWPLEGDHRPASVIRPPVTGRAVTVLAGSCHNAAPQGHPYDLTPDRDPRGVGPDALAGASSRLAEQTPDLRDLPDLVVLVGDQVYADADPTGHHDHTPAGFAAHAELYCEAWSEPSRRWLLSTVPSAMIWDDHEVIDDWNISASWVAEVRRRPDWDERIAGALGAYWVHQHLGNLSPEELDGHPLLAELRAAEDGWELLREAAATWDRGTAGTEGARWSHHRRVGEVDVVAIDSRNGRLLTDGDRWMHDEAERRWLEERVADAGGRHLILATSLPVLLPPGLHGVERWSEAVVAGRFGQRASQLGERLRRRLDLEHWSAFGQSFDWLEDLLIAALTGSGGPRSVTLLSGDVHFAYVAPTRRRDGATLPLTQVVTSPVRNRLPGGRERQIRLAASPLGRIAGVVALALSGARRPHLRWSLRDGPFFDNNTARLHIDDAGVEAVLQLEVPGHSVGEASRPVEAARRQLAARP